MPDDHFALPSGYRLEEYEIREVLGAGALGIKYVGFDHDRDQSVVIKEYLPDHLAARTDSGIAPKSPSHRADFDAELNRFLEEGEALTRIAHQNLAQMQRCVRANGTGYIVRDYIQGEILSDLLEQSTTLSEGECKSFLFPILNALEALHGSNFLHRDIGPDKIVVREDGSPALLGFPEQRQVAGARKVFGARSRGSSFVLRPGYAALEQYSQIGHLGAWTDIYGLGVVMYRCATGLVPPEATERAVADEMIPVSKAAQRPYSASALAAIDAALAIRAHERPQNVVAWRRLFEVPSDQSPRAVRQAARGQMFAPQDMRRPDVRPRSASAQAAATPETARRWGVPAIAATALIAILTWVDTGILRSSGSEGNQSATPPTPGESLPTDSSQEPATEQPQTASRPEQEGPSGEAARAPAPPTEVSSTEESLPREQPEFAQAGADPVEQGQAPVLSTLVVETTPPGAEVLIAGEVVGQTPLEIPELAAGSYDVTLRHGLHETLSETVTVPNAEDSDGTATRMTRTLARATGALTVLTEPARAWIEHDGKRFAERTPTTLHGLPAGPLELTVGVEGHRPMRVRANIPRNSVRTLELTLEDSIVYGTLTLELAPEDAEATLPDLELAYEAGMRIPHGQHRVRVTRDGYVPQTRTVEVAGPTASPISLTRNPQPFTVTTTPAGAFVSFPLGEQSYSPGVLLTPGNYNVRAVLPGYATWEGAVNHAGPTDHAITLRTGIAEFADPLVSGGTGPTMVAIAAGSFRMGCVSRVDCRSNELPVHEVTLAKPLALSKFEVTCDEFAHFIRATDHESSEEAACSTETSAPVVNVSWHDAVAYAEWLSRETRRPYRLPSEAEWEYAARSGTTTRYSWGSSIGVERANCNGCRNRANRDHQGTVVVGSFGPNPWGLHDMLGNAWEWVSDCRLDDYAGAAGDGSPRIATGCEQRVLRGGSWRVNPSLVRAAQRGWGDQSFRLDDVGIRVIVEMQ